MLVELDEEHTKCGICVTKFSSDRDNNNPEIRKHLPVLSSSQRCDHWFCHGCILREQLRVAEENNGRIPKWIRCMHCREKTSFNPAEPKYHRLLIDLLARAQKYAAAQVKNEEQTEVEENETTDVTLVKQEQNDVFCEDYSASEETVYGEGARSVKRETDINDLGEQEVKRMKLIAPSPPLVRVKEEPTEYDDYDETSSLERRPPINGINTSTNNADNTPAAPKVVDKDHRMCSVCKVAKSLDCFSIRQRKKGKNAKCKDCIENLPALLAAKNKAMEDLEERNCVNCNIVKKKENFGIKERRKGEASVCKSCKKDANVKIREQRRIEREEAIKSAVKENAEKEARTLRMAKGAYEQYITKLKATGSTIEEEMTKQSDLLYIVTSISMGEDPFGPCLHGIYTTCQKAQDAARKTFEKLSESYRDGEFVSHETRIAQCDMNNFLIPGVEGAFRPLFEVLFVDPYEEYQECTAIAINVVRIGIDVQDRLPYIQCGSPYSLKHFPETDNLSEDSSANTTANKDSKVHVLFSSTRGEFANVEDVALIGIYKHKEVAMNRAREYPKAFIDEKLICNYKSYTDADGVSFVHFEESRTGEESIVSIHTVILDDDHGAVKGEENEISIMGEDVWLRPQIRWY